MSDRSESFAPTLIGLFIERYGIRRRRKTAESDTSGDESESDQDTGGAYRGVKSKRSNAEEAGETPLRRSNR